MTDRGINIKLWGAFLLGARVLAGQNGRDVSLEEIGVLGQVARQLAESDTTLEDPTALAAREPDIGPLLQRLGTINIRNNRDLAKRIFEGFTIATHVSQ